MNESVAKKVGEAYAFAQTLAALHEKTPAVLDELLGEHAARVQEQTAHQVAVLGAVVDAAGFGEMVREKAARTQEKIERMGEMYVGDEWDDAAEVLEWLSFFLGAAVIHWQLIAGAAEEIGSDDTSFADESAAGAEYYHELLHAARTKAANIGQDRARA